LKINQQYNMGKRYWLNYILKKLTVFKNFREFFHVDWPRK